MDKDKKKPNECEAWFSLSLREVSSSFGVPSALVVEMIDEGIIPVTKENKNEWQFDNEAIRSIRTVLRLHHDLGVNMAGAALAIELLKEIDNLRALLENKG